MYLLTEWEGRTGIYLARGHVLTESQIGRDYIRSDGCARGTITWEFLQQNFVIYQFLRVEQETHNSSKNTIHVLIFVHAKKPTESWHKAVKNMSSHQKLSEWQKVASRFTEIVYKSSSEDSRKCRRRFKLFVDLLDSLIQGTTGQLNTYDTCWLLQTVPGFADFAGVVEITRLNTSEVLYLSAWTVR